MKRFEKAEIRKVDWALLKRLYSLIRPYRLAFYSTALLACFLALLAPVRPALVQLAIDEHVFNKNMEGLINISILMALLLVLESVTRYGFIYFTNWVGQNIVKSLRVRVYKHILALKLRFYDMNPIGALTTRVVNDLESINNVFSQGLVMIISDMMTIVFVLAIMFYYDWQLAFATLSPLPIMVLSTYLFQKKVRRASEKVRAQVSNMNTYLQEHLSGMHLIQIFSRHQSSIREFDDINLKHRSAHIETVWYYAVFFPVVEILLACSIGMLVWWGGQRILDMEIQLGHLVAYILYVHMLYRPIRQLADRFGTLQMGIVASDRVFKVLDQKEFIENKGNLMPQNMQGEITFRDVCFSYDNKTPVLNNVSFNIKSGETLAIVGETGAGKTTIINALCRFYEISSGNIFIDGKDIRELELNEYRKNLGLVLQDVFLFSGSISENISMGNTSIGQKTIEEAAKAIGADEFIERLPGGYQFNPMERGVSLSMGQRQLVSFIRAMAFNPKILILDEATSSVDSSTEHLVQKAITRLLKDRTSIIIAHRLSTIQHADQIIVMSKGSIIEQGTHNSLLKKKGEYYSLYETQFKLQELV